MIEIQKQPQNQVVEIFLATWKSEISEYKFAFDHCGDHWICHGVEFSVGPLNIARYAYLHSSVYSDLVTFRGLATTKNSYILFLGLLLPREGWGTLRGFPSLVFFWSFFECWKCHTIIYTWIPLALAITPKMGVVVEVVAPVAGLWWPASTS